MSTLPFLLALTLLMDFYITTEQFDHISSPGDIVLGGLFPVHKEGYREDMCGPFNEIPGYQYLEAMRYAVDQINKRTDILPGIQLGTILYDTCRSPTITADRTKSFIKFSLISSESVGNGPEFAGVIGPFTSGNSIMVANFLRVFEIPQISYSALTVQLSDKGRYGYFFRTVPPDSFFAEGLARLLEHFRWSYVSIIYSTGTYSETGTEEVIKALTKRNICLAKKHRLPRFPTSEHFGRAIEDVMSAEEANVVVFITIQRDSRGLLMAKRRNPLARRLAIIASVSWSNRDDITKSLERVAEGAITFGHIEGRSTEFENHFRSLNLSNYQQNDRKWFEEFWESQFNCSVRNTSHHFSKKCTGQEELSSHQMEIAPVRVVINAVNAISYALENMRKKLCPNVSGICGEMKPLPRNLLRKLLENVTFPDSSFNWPIRFNRNNEVAGNYTVFNFRESERGVYSYVPIGNWTSSTEENGDISGKLDLDTSKIRWPNGGMVPTSGCSKECMLDSVKQSRPPPLEICCWDCVTCNKYDVTLNNTCRACAEGYIPDADYTSCLKLEVKYMNLGKPFALFLVFFSFVGLIINIAVFFAFYINRNHPLVKATNIEASSFIFCGIFLIFITSVVFLAKPTQSLCYAQRFLLGNSFSICYVALLVKLRRIHGLSKRENQLRNQRESTNFLGLKPPLLPMTVITSIITIQLLLTVLITIKTSSKLQEIFYPETEEVLLECPLKSLVFVAYIGGCLVLVCGCTGYAFLTRNIQKNFRETLYVSLTTYISNVLWVVLLAYFPNTEHSFSRLYLIAGISLLIGWLTLLGLFAPVIYHLRTKKVFDRVSLFHWDTVVAGGTQGLMQGGQPDTSLHNIPRGILRVKTLSAQSNQTETASSKDSRY